LFQRYPLGCDITASPAGLEVFLLPTQDGISVTGRELAEGTLITLEATKRTSGPRSFPVNGATLTATTAAKSPSSAQPPSPSFSPRTGPSSHDIPSNMHSTAVSTSRSSLATEVAPKTFNSYLTLMVSFIFLIFGAYLSHYVEHLL